MEQALVVKPDLIVLLSRAVSTPADSWTEHLCLQCIDGRGIELSIRAQEVLADLSALEGDVVWPEGCDPGACHEVDADNDLLPLSIDGKRVWGRDGDVLLGRELVPITDTTSARFALGEIEAAQTWLERADWQRVQGYDAAWLKISEAIATLSK